MISSVSVFESHQTMVKHYGSEYCEVNNCNGFYLWRHVKNIFLGMVVFSAGLLIPLGFWRRSALTLFVIALGLLSIILLTSIGADWGTARSWINIPFLPSIQPSEIAKIALILYLAIWMDKKEQDIRTWESGFLPFVILMLPLVALIALQPDFGSLLVIVAIAAVMFFVAGGNLFHILSGGLAAIAVALPVVLSHDYIQKRFLVFLHPETGSDGASYQVIQSLITMGSGRLFGVGVGESGQRHGWLPEIQSDTIFAAAGEELGFFRIIFLVGAFALLSIIGYEVAKNARNRFEMLVAAGITAWITFQALLNMLVTLGMFPLTGVTLPFISSGGSSLLSLLFASGVLLQISKFSSGHAHHSARRRIGRTHFPRIRHSL